MKVITLDDEGFPLKQGTLAWKQLRVGLFTGTGIGDLLPASRGDGKARQTQIDEVVTEILTGMPAGGDFKGNKYTKHGVEHEPFARMAYEELTGNIIEEVAFIRHDWLRAGFSPDGMVLGRKRNIEIKCPKDTTHLRYLQMTECPKEHLHQVASQQWGGAFEETDFISYHPGFPPNMRLHIITVPRQVELISKIETEVTRAHSEVNLIIKSIKELCSARKEVA